MIRTLNDFLDLIAEQFGLAEAYVWFEEGNRVSKNHIELRQDSGKMAREIHRLFGTDHKIALIGDLSYSWICTFFGIINSGNIAVPMDTKTSAAELTDRLDFADVSVVFLSKHYHDLEAQILKDCAKVEKIYMLEEYPFCISSFESGALPPVDPEAVSSLMFTSGTTGDGFKAAMITQKGMLADATGYAPVCMPGDRVLSILPIHHCFELFVGQMKCLYMGAAICINDSVANILKNLSVFKIASVLAVPSVANLLSSVVEREIKTKTAEEIRQLLGGHLNRITIGGAPTNAKIIETLSSVGITVIDGYGLTESTGGCLCNQNPALMPEAAGTPYVKDMQVKISDGEICLKGPMIMKGYYKSPALTEKVMEGDWFHTGDLGEITENGYVVVYGRKDNLIKLSNGEKVYPEECEDILSNIDNVNQNMVCALDDHLVALVLLKDQSEECKNDLIEKVNQINDRMPNYKKIMDIRFRSTPFPMTSSMKIKRAVVLKELSGESKLHYIAPENDRQASILKQVYQMIPGLKQVGIDDNLFEHGMDSLSALNLSIHLNCDPTVIYRGKTIRAIAELTTGLSSQMDEINQDVNKVQNINNYIGKKSYHNPMAAQGSVLITGANGFLGIHIMKELADAGKQVVCLVRNKQKFEQACSYYGVSAGKSTELIFGDITKQRFGLSENEYHELAKKVTAVFHIAALVSHVGNVDRSYKINVLGTNEVIEFCRISGAQLYHMSSYAVSGFHTDKVLHEGVLDIGQQLVQNPYIQTKYQAEERVLMARGEAVSPWLFWVTRKAGVPSTIFRIGNLTARASDGKFQINAEENGLAAQIRALNKLKCFPASMNKVVYDNTPVDKTARAIVLLALTHGTGYIWHIMNPEIKNIAEVADCQEVPDDTFNELLTSYSSDRDVAIFSIYYRMLLDGFNPKFDFSKTVRELEGLGFHWNE